MDDQVETHQFQAEAQQLLQMVIHAIYSNKDVFLRELVSNASDALDKVRLAVLVDKDLVADTSDPHIAIEVDRDARTLTVRDNGIGMSREEVVALIGTIAKSGTAELVRQLKDADPAASRELIGQFGVGFYAAFMVADEVTLVTRRAGEPGGTRWSSTGAGTYTIEALAEAPAGTAVTLHLKPADDDDRMFDYTETWKLREIVKRYSDFIAWPIRMDVGKDGKSEIETLNSRKALWSRSKDEVEPAEYNEFYRHVSHDWTDPLEVVALKAEGTFEYEALLFIPARSMGDMFTGGRRGVQLYVKRVFIMDDCPELMPSYLRFVTGVVDAKDLSLNISREILQQDRQIQLMRRRLVRKVLSTIKDMRANEPEKYATFWEQFGRVVKEGLLDDRDNRAAILEVASFASTRDPQQPVTLADYVARMPDGQTDVYYLTGENRTVIERSPHLEGLLAKGYEVLLLTDPVDEVWVDAVGDFDGKPLRSVAKGQVDVADDAAGPETSADFAALLTWLTETLQEQVKEVRLTGRLTTSPACVVGDPHDLTPTLERMYRAMGQAVPPIKRILELNPAHPLVTGLRAAYERDGAQPALEEMAELIYGMALLAEGGDLTDPARFAGLLANRLTRTL